MKRLSEADYKLVLRNYLQAEKKVDEAKLTLNAAESELIEHCEKLRDVRTQVQSVRKAYTEEAIVFDKVVLDNLMNGAVMARLRAPFKCEYIPPRIAVSEEGLKMTGRWRIADANDYVIVSVSGLEEGYARLIVVALNEYYDRR